MRTRDAFLLSSLLMVAGCDVVSDTYRDMEHARAEALFDRGWLPDILPESARLIRVNNDLDVNTSWGSFHFDRVDYVGFVSRILQSEPVGTKSKWLVRFEQDGRRRGYDAHTFWKEGAVWQFVCQQRRASCEYRMELLRDTKSP